MKPESPSYTGVPPARNQGSRRVVRHIAWLLGAATVITVLGLSWLPGFFFFGYHVVVVLVEWVGLNKMVAILLGIGVNVAVWALAIGFVVHRLTRVSKDRAVLHKTVPPNPRVHKGGS